MLTWRAMRPGDLPKADRLGTLTHVHHPERPEIAAERLALAPRWCFVLADLHHVHGYCVAHPWGGALPPGLDTLLGSLPEAPDWLHIHDLVVTKECRGSGVATPLITRLIADAARQGLGWASLVAVGGAERYWLKLGFAIDPEAMRLAFVTNSYGADAVPMRCRTAIAAA